MQYEDQLSEYKIGGIIMEEMDDSDEMYSGLTSTIKMEHLFANEVSTNWAPAVFAGPLHKRTLADAF